jgi:hypothetical protein
MRNGKLRIISLDVTSSGAGVTSVALLPPIGKVWEILHAYGYHADAAGCDSAWYLTDPDLSALIFPTATALAANSPLVLGALVGGTAAHIMIGGEPPRCTLLRYYSFVWNATAAAKHGYVKAAVHEFSGIVEP